MRYFVEGLGVQTGPLSIWHESGPGANIISRADIRTSTIRRRISKMGRLT